MYDRGCLIIDDVAASVSVATAFGQHVLGEPAEEVRAAVRHYAESHGWPVLPHERFMAWASTQLEQRHGPWLVLDPLARIASGRTEMVSVRFSRQHEVDGEFGLGIAWNGQNPTEAWLAGRNVGILDDAAASGRTIAYTEALITTAGETLDSVLVCASSQLARQTFQASHRNARWCDFFPGDWRVAHLRDGCPFLPFSGRPLAQPVIVGLDGSPLQARVSSTVVKGNLWQVLWLDPTIRRTILEAWALVVHRLAAELGRPALAEDLCLLGGHVPVLTHNNERVTATVPLEQLIPK